MTGHLAPGLLLLERWRRGHLGRQPSKPMKKPTKSIKSPAPAKRAPVKVTVNAVAPAPVVKKTVPKPLITKIEAQIDVGFGNALYIRGEGPGLSWESGVLMTCVSDDRWSTSIANATSPV